MSKFLKIPLLILILNLSSCIFTSYVKEDLKFTKPPSQEILNDNKITNHYQINCIYLNGPSDDFLDVRYSYIFKGNQNMNFSRGDKNLTQEKLLIDEAIKYFITNNFLTMKNNNSEYFLNIRVKIDRNYPVYKTVGNSVLTGLTLLLYPGKIDNHSIETQIELFEINSESKNKKLINSFSYQRNLVERVGLFSIFYNFKHLDIYTIEHIGQAYANSRNQSLENAIYDMFYEFSNDLKE